MHPHNGNACLPRVKAFGRFNDAQNETRRMKELKVDLGTLELAFSSDNEFMSAYFDAETGNTHFLEAGLLSRIEEEDPDELVEATASGPTEDDLSLARQIFDSWGLDHERLTIATPAATFA
jgi:hypothetical protein